MSILFGSQDNKENLTNLNILNASFEAMELAVGQLKMDFKKGYIDGPYVPKNSLGKK